jgi:penicillin-binding protein 1A
MQAGKTGTTQAYRDAWFVGFTGWYAASVWFGNDDYTSTANMTGGSLPAIAWHAIMEPIHAGLGFKPIPGVPVPADLVASAPKPAVAAAAPSGDAVPQQSLTPAAVSVIREVGDAMRARAPEARPGEAALLPASVAGPPLALVTPPAAGQSSVLLNGLSLLGDAEAGAVR